jgi:hypothetical protein
MLKGAIHVHSRYSDGEFTLPELQRLFRTAGCSFVCMTDHAESFTAEKLHNYLGQCEELSGADFCFIPGLEYECKDKMHILGYGQTSLVNTKEPQEVIQSIERKGGISVIAHPKEAAFPYIEAFDVLPSGIEGWNTKYDGRYAPRPGTFCLIDRLRQRKPGTLHVLRPRPALQEGNFMVCISTFSRSRRSAQMFLQHWQAANLWVERAT